MSHTASVKRTCSKTLSVYADSLKLISLMFFVFPVIENFKSALSDITINKITMNFFTHMLTYWGLIINR